MTSCTQVPGATIAPADSMTPGPWRVSPYGDTTSVCRESDKPFIAVTPIGRPLDERRANACLIAAAPDHADIGWAMCMAAGHWDPWGDGRGEFVLNGLRFTTELDQFGVPKVTDALREQIRQARGGRS